MGNLVTGNFALSFSLKFLSIFVHISGSIKLIWVSMERFFPPAELEYTRRWCHFQLKVITPEVQQRLRLIIIDYGWHRSQ